MQTLLAQLQVTHGTFVMDCEKLAYQMYRVVSILGVFHKSN